MGERLHFLDWLRMLLVAAVVYAHLTFCGLNRPGDLYIDDHAYNMVNPNSMRGRWISLCRPWTIPVLFWVSGASLGITFNGNFPDFCKGMKRLLIVTVVGIAGNATMWLLSPRDPHCGIQYAETDRCKGKGILFDFTEDPFAGNVEPYFNQMWYTCILLIIMPASWPMCKVVSGFGGHLALAFQFLGFSLLHVFFAVVVGDESPNQLQLGLQLVFCEGAFLALAALAGMYHKRPAVLTHVPLRAVHYACGIVAVVQIGASPMSCGKSVCLPDVGDMTLGFLLYMFVGVVRWFQLGFIMTRPRKSEADVEPLLSNGWPAVMIFFCFVIPSTNWYMAGVLPYAYYPRTVDRVLYCSATIGWMFVIDRCSREMKQCRALPQFLQYGSLVLYVGQIVLLTIFMQAGFRHIETIWFLAAGTAVLLGLVLSLLLRRPAARASMSATASFAEQQGAEMQTSWPEVEER